MFRRTSRQPRDRDDGQQAPRPPASDVALPGDLLGHVHQLEVRARRLVTAALAGEYRSVYRGSGIEFAEARLYSPGDDVRFIDWNVTARMGEPWVKEFVEERELTVVTAVDVSPSMAVGRGAGGRREAAAAICALLSLAATYHHDRAGLALFSDRVERFVEPRRTTRHAMRLVAEVLGHQGEGGGTSLAVLADALARALHRRSVIFVITDGYDANYEQSLRVLARRHEVTVVLLDDPADRALPDAGIVEIEDAESGRRLLLDTGRPEVRRAYADAARERRTQRADALAASGVEVVHVPLEHEPLAPVVEHIRARARRIGAAGAAAARREAVRAR